MVLLFPKNIWAGDSKLDKYMTYSHPLTHLSTMKIQFLYWHSYNCPTQSTITSDQHVWTSPWTSTDVSSSSVFVKSMYSSQTLLHSASVKERIEVFGVLFQMALNQIIIKFRELLWLSLYVFSNEKGLAATLSFVSLCSSFSALQEATRLQTISNYWLITQSI